MPKPIPATTTTGKQRPIREMRTLRGNVQLAVFRNQRVRRSDNQPFISDDVKIQTGYKKNGEWVNDEIYIPAAVLSELAATALDLRRWIAAHPPAKIEVPVTVPFADEFDEDDGQM